jgi:AraC-like DNA-binding protein
MKLYIKNMIDSSCKLLVQQVLDKLSINYTTVRIGEVFIAQHLGPQMLHRLREDLLINGFILVAEKQSSIIDRAVILLIEMVHFSEELPKKKVSVYLSEKLLYPYESLSRLFSEIKGVTIEQFIIQQKVDRAKEMILSTRMSLTEIAYELHYSSASHFTNQFKKITGISPSQYKKRHSIRWRPLDGQ